MRKQTAGRSVGSAASSTEAGRRVAIVGAGGVIGSHLAPHIARMPEVEAITLIDPGSYEEKNLYGQQINEADVGRRKAMVQAERLALHRPQLTLIPLCQPVESVPWGCLRCDVLLACPDSLAVRLYVNQVAWRLGIPWIDAGVRADGLLARVNVYEPGCENPCLECALDDGDYEGAGQSDPCLGEAQAAPTNAPSSLGALAASLQAIECYKFLAEGSPISGRQVLLETRFHHYYVTNFALSSACRFDHQTWDIHPLEISPAASSIGDLCSRVDSLNGQPTAIRLVGQTLATCLACTGCGTVRNILFVCSRISEGERRCPSCHQRMVAPGPHQRENLLFNEPLEERFKTGSEQSLAELGLRHGDVLEVIHPGGDTSHIEIRNRQVGIHPPQSLPSPGQEVRT
ncbi:MAG: ThiF family adenylyltransferase [Acidobacteriota bacterium]